MTYDVIYSWLVLIEKSPFFNKPFQGFIIFLMDSVFQLRFLNLSLIFREAHKKPCQASIMELSMKTIND